MPSEYAAMTTQAIYQLVLKTTQAFAPHICKHSFAWRDFRKEIADAETGLRAAASRVTSWNDVAGLKFLNAHVRSEASLRAWTDRPDPTGSITTLMATNTSVLGEVTELKRQDDELTRQLAMGAAQAQAQAAAGQISQQDAGDSIDNAAVKATVTRENIRLAAVAAIERLATAFTTTAGDVRAAISEQGWIGPVEGAEGAPETGPARVPAGGPGGGPGTTSTDPGGGPTDAAGPGDATGETPAGGTGDAPAGGSGELPGAGSGELPGGQELAGLPTGSTLTPPQISLPSLPTTPTTPTIHGTNLPLPPPGGLAGIPITPTLGQQLPKTGAGSGGRPGPGGSGLASVGLGGVGKAGDLKLPGSGTLGGSDSLKNVVTNGYQPPQAAPAVGSPPVPPAALPGGAASGATGGPAGAPPPMMPPMAGAAGRGTGALSPGRARGAQHKDRPAGKTPGVPAKLRGRAGKGETVFGGFPAAPTAARTRRRDDDQRIDTVQALDEELWAVEQVNGLPEVKPEGRRRSAT